MSLSRTVSEINDVDFSRKSPTFPIPVHLTSPVKGLRLEFGTDARGQKTRMMELPDGQPKQFYDRFIRLDTIPACDRQADRHATTTKTRLRIA